MRIAIVGPTATGKSDVALELAHRVGTPSLNGIISADAYQLYRGMDIGTATIPPERRRGIEHFQIDVLDITDNASVATFQRHARADANTIEQRGGVVFMAGGSGLYARAVMDDLSFPGTDPQLRRELQRRADTQGIATLYDQLRDLDPASAQRIDMENQRRVIRALEVCLLTGKPFSATLPQYRYVAPWIQIGIQWDNDTLQRRIEQRTRRMFDNGWIDEVAALVDQGFEETKTARRALGYAQALQVYHGSATVDQAIEDVTRATMKLTKKQWKWFKRDPRIHWLDTDAHTVGDDPVLSLTDQALQIIGRHSHLNA